MENSDPYFSFKNAHTKCFEKYYMFFLPDKLLVRCNFDTYFLTFTIQVNHVNFSGDIFIKKKKKTPNNKNSTWMTRILFLVAFTTKHDMILKKSGQI